MFAGIHYITLFICSLANVSKLLREARISKAILPLSLCRRQDKSGEFRQFSQEILRNKRLPPEIAVFCLLGGKASGPEDPLRTPGAGEVVNNKNNRQTNLGAKYQRNRQNKVQLRHFFLLILLDNR